MKVGETVISMGHGTLGGLIVVPFALQSRRSNLRVSVAGSIRGWLSGPIPTGPIRAVVFPTPRSCLCFGHQPMRVSCTTARCDRIVARADHPSVRLGVRRRVLELQRPAVDPVQRGVLGEEGGEAEVDGE